MLRNEFSPERHRFIDKLETVAILTEEERQAVLRLPMVIRSYARGQDIVREGDRPDACSLLLDGFVHGYRLLPDGRRQITSYHVPGDMPDLQGLHLGVMSRSLAAMSLTEMAFVPHRSVRDLTNCFPGLLHALWRITLIEAAILQEWMTGAGRRSAYERLAHLLCEMLMRLRAVGPAPAESFHLPVRQTELADTLGLSAVHVNRVLQELRRDKMITWTGSRVTVLRWQDLQDAGTFNATYLHQDVALLLPTN